jgi:hypothetical protein
VDRTKFESFAAVDRHQSDGVDALRRSRQLAEVPLVREEDQTLDAIEQASRWQSGSGWLGSHEIHELPDRDAAGSV